ncbi:MAG: general secretion pathway protein GspB [Candidatus Omnitrophota bacterium]
MSLGVVVLAQDMLSSDVVLRPQVTYRSAQLRDPFVSVLTNEAKPANQGLAMEKPKIDPNKFKVQGLIWGSKLPQTIINGTVLRIGDFIEEAEVLEIDKKGVVLSISGQIVNLSAPGQSGIIKDKTKEE